MTAATLLPDADFLSFLPPPGADMPLADCLPLADRLADADDPRECFFRAFAAAGPARRLIGTALCSWPLTDACTVRLAAVCDPRSASYRAYRPDQVEVSLLVRHPDHPGEVQEVYVVMPVADAAPLAGTMPEHAARDAGRRAHIWAETRQMPAGWVRTLMADVPR